MNEQCLFEVILLHSVYVYYYLLVWKSYLHYVSLHVLINEF